MPLESKVEGEKEGSFKTKHSRGIQQIDRKGANISLVIVVLSDNVLHALAAAETTPDAFHETGRGTTTVTFNLPQKLPGSKDCHQPCVPSKRKHRRGCFTWVHFQAN